MDSVGTGVGEPVVIIRPRLCRICDPEQLPVIALDGDSDAYEVVCVPRGQGQGDGVGQAIAIQVQHEIAHCGRPRRRFRAIGMGRCRLYRC